MSKVLNISFYTPESVLKVIHMFYYMLSSRILPASGRPLKVMNVQAPNHFSINYLLIYSENPLYSLNLYSERAV